MRALSMLGRGLVALCCAGSLLSCGGGGGGGGSSTPSGLSVTVSGLEGGTLLVADGRGNSLNLTSNGSARFPTPAAGSSYTVAITGQPANQVCVVNGAASGSYSGNTSIAIRCASGIAFSDGSSSFGSWKIVSVEVRQAFTTLTASLTDSSGSSTPLTPEVIASRLNFVMPELAPGAYTLHVSAGGRNFSRALTVTATALPGGVAPKTYLSDRATAALDEVESLLAGLGPDDDDSFLLYLRQKLQDGQAAISGLSDDAARREALWLAANQVASSALPSSFLLQIVSARTGLTNPSGCMARARVFVTGVVTTVAAVGLIALSPATLAGAVVTIAVGGVGLYTGLRLIRDSIDGIMDDCIQPVIDGALDMVGIGSVMLTSAAGRFALLPASSASSPQSVVTLSSRNPRLEFRHQMARNFELQLFSRMSDEVPDKAISEAQRIAAFYVKLNNLLPDGTALPGTALATRLTDVQRDYEETLPAAGLVLQGISDDRISGSLSAAGDVLQLDFQFKPGITAREPVDFSFRLLQPGNDEGQGAEYVVQAKLSANPPQVFPQFYGPVVANGGWKARLGGEDVDSYEIDTPPAQGTLTLDDPVTGAFTYLPAADFSGTVTFTFRGRNPFGASSPATATLTINPACSDTSIAGSLNYHCDGWLLGREIDGGAGDPQPHPNWGLTLQRNIVSAGGALQNYRQYFETAYLDPGKAGLSPSGLAVYAHVMRVVPGPDALVLTGTSSQGTFDPYSGNRIDRTAVERRREVVSFDGVLGRYVLQSQQLAYAWLDKTYAGGQPDLVSYTFHIQAQLTGYDIAGTPQYTQSRTDCSRELEDEMDDAEEYFLWTGSWHVQQRSQGGSESNGTGACPFPLSSFGSVAAETTPSGLQQQWTRLLGF